MFKNKVLFFFINDCSLKRTMIKDIILAKILEDPSRRYYIIEIAREAKTSPSAALKAIDELQKEGLVRREAKRHIVEIAANTENPDFCAKKRIHNLSVIYSSGILDYLLEKCDPKAIVLFGKFSKGDDLMKSDVEIAVIAGKKKVDLARFEKNIRRKIAVVFVDYRKISDELYVSLINGITVYGILEKK